MTTLITPTRQELCPVATFHEHYLDLHACEVLHDKNVIKDVSRADGGGTQSVLKRSSLNVHLSSTARARSKSFDESILRSGRATLGLEDPFVSSLCRRPKHSEPAATQCEESPSTPKLQSDSNHSHTNAAKLFPEKDSSPSPTPRQRKIATPRRISAKKAFIEDIDNNLTDRQQVFESRSSVFALEAESTPSKKRRFAVFIERSSSSSVENKSESSVPNNKSGLSDQDRKEADTLLSRLLGLNFFRSAKSVDEQATLLLDLVRGRRANYQSSDVKSVIWERPVSTLLFEDARSNHSDKPLIKVEPSEDITRLEGLSNTSSAAETKQIFDITKTDREDRSLAKTYTLEYQYLDLSEALRMRRIIPYLEEHPRMSNTEENIKRVMQTQLTVLQMLPKSRGWIYVYWYPATFGLVKIGRSGRTVEERLAEWKRDCGRTPLLIYSSEEDEQGQVPHVKRVEALIAAELVASRKIEENCICTKRSRHEEWFEESWGHAVTVVKKWIDWMRTEPYKPDGTLRPEQRANLKELCRPSPRKEKTDSQYKMLQPTSDL